VPLSFLNLTLYINNSNKDGTTRKIANWDAMTEREQKKTWERIAKRNAERLEKLREEQ